MRLVRIDGIRYATGLWWQGTERPSPGRAAVLREARATAERFVEEGYTCAALRTSQYGLGAWTGRVPSVPSLAAALAAGGSPHLGVYLLEEGGPWWVCAVKDGRVAAEGDWLGDSLEAAQRHASELRDLLALTPPVFRADVGSSREDLRRRLPRRAPLQRLWGGDRLRPLRTSHRALMVAGGSLMLLFLACSAGLFSNDGTRIRSTQEARRLDILAHADRYFPRPWLERPDPGAWAERCLTALLALPVNPQGWEMGPSQCQDDSLEAAWIFSSGASFLRLPPDTELRDPTTAVRRVRLLPVPPPAEPAPLQSRQEVAKKLYETANMFGLHLNLTWDPPLENTVHEGNLSVPVTAPWRRARWTFTDLPAHLVLSREFYGLLRNVPGLVVEQLSHDNGKWELKGICHGHQLVDDPVQ